MKIIIKLSATKSTILNKVLAFLSVPYRYRYLVKKKFQILEAGKKPLSEAVMSAKATFSIADLQSGAKRLNTCEIAENKTNNNDQKSSFDSAALLPLEVLTHCVYYVLTFTHYYNKRSCTTNMMEILMKYLVN